jgi:peptidyl-prolyl cis-trans isomerase D
MGRRRTSATSSAAPADARIDVKLLDTPAGARETLDAWCASACCWPRPSDSTWVPTDERLQRLFVSDPQFARCATPTAASTATAGRPGHELGDVRPAAAPGPGHAPGAGGIGAGAGAGVAAAALDPLLQRREVQLQRFDRRPATAAGQAHRRRARSLLQGQRGQFRARSRRASNTWCSTSRRCRRPWPCEDDLRRYYEENASRYTAAEERRASHILIKADKDMPAAERRSRQGQGRGPAGRAAQGPGQLCRAGAQEQRRPGSAARAATSTSSDAARWSSPSRTRSSR